MSEPRLPRVLEDLKVRRLGGKQEIAVDARFRRPPARNWALTGGTLLPAERISDRGAPLRVALSTGMRAGEITSLTWAQVDFARQVVTVGKAKSAAGTGRQIPMNRDHLAVFSIHADWFTKRFGQAEAWHYLFPFGKPTRTIRTSRLRTLRALGRRFGKRRAYSVACMT